ncbi:hypothetical protein [Desulfotalea psychrophila]|uniref:Uncharacterized protein n=1 Tax=Desulfotalea psychrophila (strain LSv54 / DSM 12343) TaxID=177439 RepID=Q6AN92_DESPS|nr:hypothetical protein [Desulfotalea psychrophila]CAG36182.1 unknown protein [Desulfotalea psychrophila LSv54]
MTLFAFQLRRSTISIIYALIAHIRRPNSTGQPATRQFQSLSRPLIHRKKTRPHRNKLLQTNRGGSSSRR